MLPRARADRNSIGDKHSAPAHTHSGAPAHTYAYVSAAYYADTRDYRDGGTDADIAAPCDGDARVNAHGYGRSHS